MKKKFVNSLSVLLLLSGCAASPKGEIIPVASFHEDSSSEEAELATDLLKQLGMEDSMTQITSRKMTGMLFEGNKDEIEGGVLYLSRKEGNTDTVGVFRTKDIETCRNSLTSYLADKKSEVEVYNPDETFKISNAVIMDDNRNTVILIVCSDIEKAKKTANSLLQNS